MSDETLIGLIAPLVALFSAWLGYRVGNDQTTMERLKARHDLDDRRMVIVQATMDFIAGIVREGNTDWPKIVEFNRVTQESYGHLRYPPKNRGFIVGRLCESAKSPGKTAASQKRPTTAQPKNELPEVPLLSGWG